ncbi:MAG: DUF3142 domain-containing protein [Deltaproteobacteria bacterium]|nr:DUF3142 domain-containing protein [Deltaproteobacteria bacterium]
MKVGRGRWLGVVALLCSGCRPVEAPAALEHRVYVWQRAWTEDVRASVAEHGGRFAALDLLGAQVTWDRASAAVPRVHPIALDKEAVASVAKAGRPVGLVLRVEVPPEPLTGQGLSTIGDEAAVLLTRCRALGLAPAEIQLDFDAPTARLGELVRLLQAIRDRVGPVPVAFTALPAWLGSRSLAEAASLADRFVLQVHSLDLARGPGPALVRSKDALQWAKKAEALGRPFWIALPTYSYLGALDESGRLLSAFAEAPGNVPDGAVRLEAVSADPIQLSELVMALERSRLEHLRGVAWFRMPVTGDARNWRWPTLAAVLEGRKPAARIHAKASDGTRGEILIEVSNEGDRDGPLPELRLRSLEGRITAFDGIGGCRLIELGSGTLSVQPAAADSLAPGERRVVGWLRLREGGASRVEIHGSNEP